MKTAATRITSTKQAPLSKPKQSKGSKNQLESKGNVKTTNKRQHKNSTQPNSISVDTSHGSEHLEISDGLLQQQGTSQDISRKRFKMTLPSNNSPTEPVFFRSTKEYLEGIEIKITKSYSFFDKHSQRGLTIDEYLKLKQNEFAKEDLEILKIEEKEKKLENQNEGIEVSRIEGQGEVLFEQETIQLQQQLSNEKQDLKLQQLEQQSINRKKEGENKENVAMATQCDTNASSQLNNNIIDTQNLLNTSFKKSISEDKSLEQLKLNDFMRGHPCSELIHIHFGIYGEDEPNGIIQMEAHPWKQGELIYLVTWAPRKKKIQLLPSWVNASTFKIAFPQLVIDYYQSFIRLKD